jgi:hypothetical protein
MVKRAIETGTESDTAAARRSSTRRWRRAPPPRPAATPAPPDRKDTTTMTTKAECDNRDVAIAQFSEACERFAQRLRGVQMTLTRITVEPTDLVAIAQGFLDALGVTVADLRRAEPRKVPRLDSDLAPDQTRH